MKAALIAMLLATPNFPGDIQQQLGLAQPPPCTVCHATNAGGPGTVVKPFGIYLQSRGLVPFDDASLRNALLADIAERHSSGGGLTDVDALRAGQDPNGVQGSNLVPAYGCSSAGSSVDFLALYALGACLLLRSRRSNLRRRNAAKRLRGSWIRRVADRVALAVAHVRAIDELRHANERLRVLHALAAESAGASRPRGGDVDCGRLENETRFRSAKTRVNALHRIVLGL